jgi:hypothetical protein
MTKNTEVFNDICEVTEEDVAKGMPEEADRCPIALAMYRNENAKISEYTDEEPLNAYVSCDGGIKISAHRNCPEAGIDIELEYNIEIHPDDVDMVTSFVQGFDACADGKPFTFRYREE